MIPPCFNEKVDYIAEIQKYVHIRTNGPPKTKEEHKTLRRAYQNKINQNCNPSVLKQKLNHQRKFYVFTHKENDHTLMFKKLLKKNR